MLKDLQYSLSRLTTDVRTQMVRNNPLQRQDTKALSMWIYKERTDLASMRSLSYQHSETNRMLMEWATEERQEAGPDSRDLEDIVSKLCKLLDKQVDLEKQYAGKYRQYRHAIKAIREREEQLSEMREKKKTLQARITHLAKTNPKSPKKIEFQKELDALQKDTLETEMEMGDFKRFALREAFYLRFNAMNEFAEKSAILAGFGNYLVDLLDIDPTPAGQTTRRPYENEEVASTIVQDCLLALEAWSPAEGEQRATLAIPGMMDSDTMSMDDASSVYTMDQESGQLKAKGDHYFYQPEYNTSSSSFGPSLPPRRSFQQPPSHLYSLANPSQDRIPYPLYDNVPPPAYGNDDSSSSKQHEDKQLVEPGVFESPFQSHAHLGANNMNINMNASTSSNSIGSTGSNGSGSGSGSGSGIGAPGYNSSPFLPHSSLHGSVGGGGEPVGMYPPQQYAGPVSYQTNYQQLFRHVSMRQQQGGAQQRTYSEFQQQFMGPPGSNGSGGPGIPYRQRIDAGGFRIPPPLEVEPVLSAEEEKKQLSERYAAEEEAYQKEIKEAQSISEQEQEPKGKEIEGVEGNGSNDELSLSSLPPKVPQHSQSTELSDPVENDDVLEPKEKEQESLVSEKSGNESDNVQQPQPTESLSSDAKSIESTKEPEVLNTETILHKPHEQDT
ncbi:Eisosome component PIL1-domain-containing protein [Phycomyces blakesleeanus]